MEVSEEYKKFLNWCENKWTQEHKMQKLLSKLSNDDIDFLKEQYESRLKAEKITMLTELGKEIIKLKSYESSDGQDLVMLADIGTLFNQKINILKEGK